MRAFLSLVILTSASTVRADDAPAAKLETSAQEMSFLDVFKAAVRTAPALEHVGFDIARADASLLTAKAAEAFTLRINTDFNRTNGAPIPPSTQGNKTDVLSANMSLSRLLPTNGTLELVGNTSKTNSDFSGIATNLITTSIKLRLTQPLLRGAGPAARNRNLDRARYARDAQLLTAIAAANGFSGVISENYWRLALAWKVLEVRRSGYDLALKQKRFTEAAMRTGKIAANELIPIEAALAGREQDLLNAEFEVINRSLELRKTVGLEVPLDRLAIKTDALPEVDKTDVDLAAYVKRTIENSKELEAARATARGADAAWRGSKRDLLPKLDLRIEGGPLGTDDKLGGSVDRLTARDGYAFSAGLSFELPIGRDGARGIHLDDRANRASAQHEVIELQTNLTSAVARAVYDVRTQRLKSGIALRSIALAQANVDAELKKFELGKSTNNEIVRLQDELEIARLRHASTLADYVVAKAKLDAQAGILLDRLGVVVKTGTYNLDDFTHGKGHGHGHHPGDGHDH